MSGRPSSGEARPDQTEQDQPAEGGDVAEAHPTGPHSDTPRPTPQQARENADREPPA